MFITLANGCRLNTEHIVLITTQGRVQLSNGFECHLEASEIAAIEELVGIRTGPVNAIELLGELRQQKAGAATKPKLDESIPAQGRRRKEKA